MFKSISKIQNLRKTRILNSSTIRRCSINLPNEKVSKKKINLNKQSIELKSLSELSSTKLKQRDFDGLKQKLDSCRNVTELLYLIQPKIVKFENAEFRIIYESLFDLYHRLRNSGNLVSLNEFSRILKSSKIYRLLLNQTNQQIKILDDKTLKYLLTILFLADQHWQSEIVKITFHELKIRLPNLDLNEIASYLEIINKYLLNDAPRIDEYYEIYKIFLEMCKDKILNDEFDFKDEQLINNFYSIFLKPENDLNHEIVNHLTRKLLSPDYKFSFLLSAKLLKKINQNYNLHKKKRPIITAVHNKQLRSEFKEIELRLKERAFFPKILKHLIDKANETIVEHFEKTQSKRQLDYGLKKLHYNTNDFNFEFSNFYSEKLLAFLVPHLIDNLKLNESYKIWTLNLIQNYGKFDIYDEKLIKSIYFEIFCSYDNLKQYSKFTNEEILFLYILLVKYRLPFVDHEKIARFICSASIFKLSPLKVLIEFILNDLDNENLYSCLIKEIANLSDNELRFLSKNIFLEKIALAKYKIENSDNVSEKMKLSISQVLDYSMGFRENREFVFDDYYHLNNKMQRNGYLFNRLLVKAFCIYDKTKQDLINLTKYRYLFNIIDQIKLDDNQVL